MAYPISNPKILVVANSLDATLENMHAILTSALAAAQSNNYGEVLSIPGHNKRAQDQLAQALAYNQNHAIVEQMSLLRGATITISDVSNAFSAIDSLATTIVDNTGLFEPTINPSNRRIDWITPLPTNVQNTLENMLQQALSAYS